MPDIDPLRIGAVARTCHRGEWLTVHLAACPDPHPAVRGAS